MIPESPDNVANIRSALEREGGTISYESKSDYLGTIFFYLEPVTEKQAETFRAIAGVADVYIPRGPKTQEYYPVVNNPTNGEAAGQTAYEEDLGYNATNMLDKRASVGYRSRLIDMEMLQISWPPSNGPMGDSGAGLTFNYDDSAGRGTYLYSCDWGVTPNHDELSNLGTQIVPIYPGPFPVSDYLENDPKRHGTKCIAKMAGRNLGLAKNARVSATIIDFDASYYEHFLDALAKIYDDIYVRSRGKMAVVNMSMSVRKEVVGTAYQAMMAYLIRKIISTGAVFVTGSGNSPGIPGGYPGLFGDPSNANYIEDLIIVGSVQYDGSNWDNHAVADWVTVYAPGTGVWVPDPEISPSYYYNTGGTSFAAATVSGLAAYLRGIAPDSFTTAAAVKREILRLAYVRRRTPNKPAAARWERRVIWNGQQGSDSAVGGGGSVAIPPIPSPVSFQSGSASPTCTSGSRCGVSCAGFFCATSNLTHNPDFEDPQNPDSVQNPDGPNYGNWDGTTPLVTATKTGGSSPAPTGDQEAIDRIPGCLAVYIITRSTQSGTERGTIDGVVVYKGGSSEVCSGAQSCTDFRDYGGVLPPVCRAGPLTCGNGYTGSATQVVSRGTLDRWMGVRFQAPGMANAAYFEVPRVSSGVRDCPTSLGGGSCMEERFGAYLDGDCSAYPLFQTWASNGLIAKLSKEEATSSHPIDSSVVGRGI